MSIECTVTVIPNSFVSCSKTRAIGRSRIRFSPTSIGGPPVIEHQFRTSFRIASQLPHDNAVRSDGQPDHVTTVEGGQYSQRPFTNLPLDDSVDPAVRYLIVARRINDIGLSTDDRHLDDHGCIEVDRDIFEYEAMCGARDVTSECLGACKTGNGTPKAPCAQREFEAGDACEAPPHICGRHTRNSPKVRPTPGL